MAAGGGEVDPELNRLYQLLNKDCQMLNLDKKQKIMRKSNKRGLQLNESDINLLSVKDNPMYDSVSSSSNRESQSDASDKPEVDHKEFDLSKDKFAFKLKRAENHVTNTSVDNTTGGNGLRYLRSNNFTSMLQKSHNNQDDDNNSLKTSSSIDRIKRLSDQIKKRPSDVSVIGDIVKKKKITFLKSSNLFSHEEQLFSKSKGP